MASIDTDSAKELRDVVGDDATATFEDDPTFVESNPTGNASTENVTVQRDTDDVEDSEEEEEDADELDEDEALDDEENLEDDEDDEDLEDDEEADDEEDEDEEDDAAEVAASPALLVRGETEEDEDDGDVARGVNEEEFEADDMDTDQVANGWPAASLAGGTPRTWLSI
jgi:hypothetical protein